MVTGFSGGFDGGRLESKTTGKQLIGLSPSSRGYRFVDAHTSRATDRYTKTTRKNTFCRYCTRNSLSNTQSLRTSGS